jgi:uncharacterized protein (DUF305 family)
MRKMDVPYAGDPDVDVRTHMIPLHCGAVAMAEVALAHAKDPTTRAIQRREIAAMEEWLKVYANATSAK